MPVENQTAPRAPSPDRRNGQEPLLRFEHVSVRFGAETALSDVSFDLWPGETRIILGAAGSGKSVLLKTAIGLLQPSAGSVRLFGQDITHMPEHDLFALRSRVGVLFQEGGLFDSLTIAENVGYPLENQRSNGGTVSPADIERRVEEALNFVELGKTLEKFPSELSGGMRRRVGIARAVVTEPPLVLYDSPTAGLDPITANTIMALIAKERDTKDTANMIVTHRYQDGELMAQFHYNPAEGRLVQVSKNGNAPEKPLLTVFMVLREGHLVFEGSEQELQASADAYIRRFVRH